MMNAGLLCLTLCAAAVPAEAQMTWTNKGFVNVNAGVQVGSQDLTVTTPFDIYNETGSVASTLDAKGGGLFDISAGYKVWRNLTVGVGYSMTGSKTDGSITASVPDPLIFDAHRNVTASAPGLKHTENQIHFTGTWMVPVTDKIDVGVSFGPTLFLVKQDVPNSVTVSEPGAAVTNVGVDKVDESALGFHLGVDVNYMLNTRYGVGGLARYTRASIEIANASDKLKAGGFQIGAGVRVRF
ncbi:MAG: outer membrane beta-barrel protein [Vicinamibacterales bacterium]